MRWLTRSALLGVALAWAQLHQAHASCTGGPGNGVPDANALTMFVTSDITTGDMADYTGKYPDNTKAVTLGTTGILASDAICTYFATSPSAINPLYSVQIAGHTSQPYFNQDHNAGTVQFVSLLSTSTADAIDRVIAKGLGNLNVVNSARDYTHTGYCLASDITDLFTGSDGTGYAYSTSMILDENANSASSGIPVWTGTGLSAVATGGAASATAANAGGRFQAVGSGTVDQNTGFCYGVPSVGANPLKTAGDWQAKASVGATGTLQSASTSDKKNVWLNDIAGTSGVGTLGCTQGYNMYCLSGQPFDPAPLPTQPSVSGDPQFTGLQGQQFQVHGMPDEFFNLISTPAFQLNSRFTYLASGTCNYNNTDCWTHPGTYVDQLGFMFPGIQIKTVAGPHHKGLRAWVNGEEVSAHAKFRLTSNTNSTATQTITVRHPHHDTLVVESPLFTVEVTNSDFFFNFALMFHSPELLRAGRYMHYVSDSRPTMDAVDKMYPSYPMHGLVGQTWKNARYPAKRYYQGEVDDYMLLDHTLFSSQFLFNLYQY